MFFGLTNACNAEFSAVFFFFRKGVELMCKREQMLADSLQQTKHNYSDLKTAQR